MFCCHQLFLFFSCFIFPSSVCFLFVCDLTTSMWSFLLFCCCFGGSLFLCLLFCLFGVVVVAVFILHTLALLREFALATALSFQVLCWSWVEQDLILNTFLRMRMLKVVIHGGGQHDILQTVGKYFSSDIVWRPLHNSSLSSLPFSSPACDCHTRQLLRLQLQLHQPFGTSWLFVIIFVVLFTTVPLVLVAAVVVVPSSSSSSSLLFCSTFFFFFLVIDHIVLCTIIDCMCVGVMY